MLEGAAMRTLIVTAVLLLFAAAPPAQAEVVSVSNTAFLVQSEADIAAPPEQVWRALTHIERWWSSEHTYSGDARNMRLDPRAGGCWCERWGRSQSVEHARVVLAMEHEGVRTLRMSGGLGPLQELGVAGVLTFTIAPHADGAKITMTYRVAGEPHLGLEQIGAPVDAVLAEQFGRLRRYIGSGTPD
jgi:uncharacterized protein YndB with AHSA1/START domain